MENLIWTVSRIFFRWKIGDNWAICMNFRWKTASSTTWKRLWSHRWDSSRQFDGSRNFLCDLESLYRIFIHRTFRSIKILMEERFSTTRPITGKPKSSATWSQEAQMWTWVTSSEKKVCTISRNNFTLRQALDKHGISALLAAIWEGHTNCVKILLNSVS